MLGLRNYFGSPMAQSMPSLTSELANDFSTGKSSILQSKLANMTPINDPADTDSPTIPPLSQDPTETSTSPRARRFSFRTFLFQEDKNHPHAQPKHEHKHKHMISTEVQHHKEEQVASALTKHLHKPRPSRSDKRAQDSAFAVRALIVGPSPRAAAPKVSAVLAKAQMGKIKSELMNPKSGNRIILKLKDMPPMEDEGSGDSVPHQRVSGPIHAVCLDHPDHEMDELHFSKLHTGRAIPNFPMFNTLDITNDSIDQISQVFNDLKIVDLITAPDLGIGQPGDGDGLLSGAVPTAETVINGIQQITPQLMALGFAAGKAIFPDHSGIYPPKDRISIFTYWWGLELALPPPTLEYLGKVESVSNAIVNFLTALSLVNNGVREIIPFVRYIAQFIEFEYGAIRKMDLGDGVVCAATWIMPAAMIPRPWDFPEPLTKTDTPTGPKTETSMTKQPPAIQAPKLSDAPSLPTVVEAPVMQVSSQSSTLS